MYMMIYLAQVGISSVQAKIWKQSAFKRNKFNRIVINSMHVYTVYACLHSITKI